MNSIWHYITRNPKEKAGERKLDEFLTCLETLSGILDFNTYEFFHDYFYKKDKIFECRDYPQVLALVFEGASQKERVSNWNYYDSKHKLEFISYAPRAMRKFLKKHPSGVKENYLQLLIKRFQDDMRGLAVICKIVGPKDCAFIWNNLVVAKNRELEFLAEVNKPDTIAAQILRESIKTPDPKLVQDLLEKHREDAAGIAAISKIVSIEQQRKIWSEIVVPNKLEIPYIQLRSDTRSIHVIANQQRTVQRFFQKFRDLHAELSPSSGT